MKNLKIKTIGILIGTMLMGLYLCAFIVDQTQYAIKIRLGDPVTIYKTPGLKFKLPFVTRIYLVDNRVMTYDADPGSIFTKDKKEMVVDNYSKWRVSDPMKFYETVRTIAGAQARLDDIIYSHLREVLGRHTIVEIVSGNRREIMENIAVSSIKDGESYGIEILDVRIKRADLPEGNSLAVYGRMEAERRREAKRYRSEGEEESLKIKSEADKDRVRIISEAEKEAAEIKGRSDAEAINIYAKAYEKDPDFFVFQRSHDAYRKSLKSDTTLLLSSERPFFSNFK